MFQKSITVILKKNKKTEKYPGKQYGFKKKVKN